MVQLLLLIRPLASAARVGGGRSALRTGHRCGGRAPGAPVPRAPMPSGPQGVAERRQLLQAAFSLRAQPAKVRAQSFGGFYWKLIKNNKYLE